MALATAAEVTARSGVTYAGTELTRVNSFLDDISAFVTQYVRPYNPAGDSVVKAIVIAEVRYQLNVEPGIDSERVDVLQTAYAQGGNVQELSDAAKAMLDDWVKAQQGIPRRGGIGSIQLISTWKPEVD